MGIRIDNWLAVLAFFVGVTLVLAVWKGHLFMVNIRKGKAETREPKNQKQNAK
jgi:hypothetical protein